MLLERLAEAKVVLPPFYVDAYCAAKKKRLKAEALDLGQAHVVVAIIQS